MRGRRGFHLVLGMVEGKSPWLLLEETENFGDFRIEDAEQTLPICGRVAQNIWQLLW